MYVYVYVYVHLALQNRLNDVHHLEDRPIICIANRKCTCYNVTTAKFARVYACVCVLFIEYYVFVCIALQNRQNEAQHFALEDRPRPRAQSECIHALHVANDTTANLSAEKCMRKHNMLFSINSGIFSFIIGMHAHSWKSIELHYLFISEGRSRFTSQQSLQSSQNSHKENESNKH